MKRTKKLRDILYSGALSFFLEAHNALSAKIVEEAGFSGIWASGLSLSASMGVRDSNEMSWSQALNVLEFICEATSIPILFDGDTGYGNFNNVRLLVSKLERLGIAGLCIEDKVFPKTNSFRESKTQQLCSIEEFSGKIRAAKDTQKDQDFCVVARTEGFIIGIHLEQVLERCEAYVRSGADAVLIHSKEPSPDQIAAFMKNWDKKIPVIIVPTTYYQTPTDYFRELNIALILWANHMVRSSIFHMQHVAKQIFTDQSVQFIDSEIAPLSEIFRLQRADELDEAERRYLP